MKTPLFVVCGNMRNGKDTFATMLQDFVARDAQLKKHFNGKVPTINTFALADNVRRMIDKYFHRAFTTINNAVAGANMEMQTFATDNTWYKPEDALGALNDLVTTKKQIWGDKNSLSRIMHQAVGEMVRLESDNTHWVSQTKKELEESTSDIAVITDMRWDSDIEFLLDNLDDRFNIITVHITRDGNSPSKGVAEFLKDSSENSLTSFTQYNYIITAKTLEELYEQSAKLILDLKRDVYAIT